MLNNSDKKDNCERYRGHSRINLINQYSKFTLARVCHRSFSLLSLSQCVVLCLSMKSTRNVLSDTCTATTLILLVVLPKSARTHTHTWTHKHTHTHKAVFTKWTYKVCVHPDTWSTGKGKVLHTFGWTSFNIQRSRTSIREYVCWHCIFKPFGIKVKKKERKLKNIKGLSILV